MSCWRENPNHRPSFHYLYDQFVSLERTLTHKHVKAFAAQKDGKASNGLKALVAADHLNRLTPKTLNAYSDPNDLKVLMQTKLNNNAQCAIPMCDNVLYTPLPLE